MPNLVRWNGKLLRKDGTLARGIECCCGPPPCPSCCITIDWGTFNGDGDLHYVMTTITVTLVMPTKHSRIVCDDENVVVVISFNGEPLENAYISWDRHWKWQGHSPSAGTGFFQQGLLEWGSLPPDNDVEYKATLQFDKCWSDNETQFGDIEAGIRDGDFTLITGTNCPSSACCEPDFPCDDCCWFIEPFNNTSLSFEFDADTTGKPVFWAVNADGDRMKITVEGTNDGVVCIGAELVIRMEMIPENFTNGEWRPAPYVVASGGWKHTAHDPDGLGVGGVLIEGPIPPMEVRWGDDIESREFTVSISLACPHAPGTLNVGFARGYEGVDVASVEIEFTCCSEQDVDYRCDICYETPVTGYFFAHIGCAPPPAFSDLCGTYPPLTTCGELYYQGSVANTVPPPDGSENYAWLWLLRGCFYPSAGNVDQQILDYSQELFDWANTVGCPGNGTGGVVTDGVIDDYYVDGMVEAYLQVPQAPDQVRSECLNVVPSACSQCPDDC